MGYRCGLACSEVFGRFHVRFGKNSLVLYLVGNFGRCLATIRCFCSPKLARKGVYGKNPGFLVQKGGAEATAFPESCQQMVSNCCLIQKCEILALDRLAGGSFAKVALDVARIWQALSVPPCPGPSASRSSLCPPQPAGSKGRQACRTPRARPKVPSSPSCRPNSSRRR